MNIQKNISLKPYNTFGIDAIAKEFIEVSSSDELIEILKNSEDKKKFFISGGSNMLITTPEIDALVIKLNLKGKKIISESEDEILIEINGGEIMHDFIMWALEQNYGGLENLSLIPGCIGTAPVQNVGAYGVEIKDVFVSCKVLNLETYEICEFDNKSCEFGYRESIFKNKAKSKYIILSIVVKLTKRNHILHMNYGDIKKELESNNIENPTIKDISNAVIAIRKAKLPDPKEIGNSGSFFKNPVVDAVTFEEFHKQNPDAPFYKTDDNQYKIPAGWLIEQSGYKGYRKGDAGVHHKQALVLVNHGNASGKELIQLATEIQNKVFDLYKINISPEVNIIE